MLLPWAADIHSRVLLASASRKRLASSSSVQRFLPFSPSSASKPSLTRRETIPLMLLPWALASRAIFQPLLCSDLSFSSSFSVHLVLTLESFLASSFLPNSFAYSFKYLAASLRSADCADFSDALLKFSAKIAIFSYFFIIHLYFL